MIPWPESRLNHLLWPYCYILWDPPQRSTFNPKWTHILTGYHILGFSAVVEVRSSSYLHNRRRFEISFAMCAFVCTVNIHQPNDAGGAVAYGPTVAPHKGAYRGNFRNAYDFAHSCQSDVDIYPPCLSPTASPAWPAHYRWFSIIALRTSLMAVLRIGPSTSSLIGMVDPRHRLSLPMLKYLAHLRWPSKVCRSLWSLLNNFNDKICRDVDRIYR